MTIFRAWITTEATSRRSPACGVEVGYTARTLARNRNAGTVSPGAARSDEMSSPVASFLDKVVKVDVGPGKLALNDTVEAGQRATR